jgi:type VI secretion system secreted protein Hcp
MAFDCFLKIDGIEGESRDQKHKGEIEILSFSFGASNSGVVGSGAGGGAGKVAFQDFHFVMNTQKSSPKLLLACATGKHIKEAMLTCRKAGKEQLEFLKIKLSDVIVSSYQTGGSGQGDEAGPLDQLSIAFGKINVDYVEQSPKGAAGSSTVMEWDVRSNKGK